MARVNVGVPPKLLSDQHLIAESVEITMITGHLRAHSKLPQIPPTFTLGKGHINFFKNKVTYLHNRLNEVNDEMRNRGFNPGTCIKLHQYHTMHDGKCMNNWSPTYQDTKVVRDRIISRLINPLKMKTPHRYYGKQIEDLQSFCDKIAQSHVYFV